MQDINYQYIFVLEESILWWYTDCQRSGDHAY